MNLKRFNILILSHRTLGCQLSEKARGCAGLVMERSGKARIAPAPATPDGLATTAPPPMGEGGEASCELRGAMTPLPGCSAGDAPAGGRLRAGDPG